MVWPKVETATAASSAKFSCNNGNKYSTLASLNSELKGSTDTHLQPANIAFTQPPPRLTLHHANDLHDLILCENKGRSPGEDNRNFV